MGWLSVLYRRRRLQEVGPKYTDVPVCGLHDQLSMRHVRIVAWQAHIVQH